MVHLYIHQDIFEVQRSHWDCTVDLSNSAKSSAFVHNIMLHMNKLDLDEAHLRATYEFTAYTAFFLGKAASIIDSLKFPHLTSELNWFVFCLVH